MGVGNKRIFTQAALRIMLFCCRNNFEYVQKNQTIQDVRARAYSQSRSDALAYSNCDFASHKTHTNRVAITQTLSKQIKLNCLILSDSNLQTQQASRYM